MKHIGNRTFGRIGIPSLPWGLGTTRSRSYFRKLITPNAAIGYDPSTLIGLWPMDESGGVISYDHSPENNNGAYTGVTLGQPGIGDGRTSPFFDGANDYNDIYSVAFNADFNPAEGSLQIWRMPFNVGVWTDAVIRYFIHLWADANNEIRILKAGAANTVFMDYRAGGVLNTVALGAEADTNYLSYGLTWSVGLNEIRGYKAGAQAQWDICVKHYEGD